MPSAASLIKQAYNYDFVNLNVLECGSHEGGWETIEFREQNNCFYIEAIPGLCNNMKQQRLVNQNNVFNYALTDYIGDIEFTLANNNLANSSIKYSDEHLNELKKYNCYYTKINVPCITYTHFINEIINKAIDILILDIEGHECIILNDMLNLPIEKLPKIISIECGYNWLERKTILQKLGYNLDFYQYNNCYLSHSSVNIAKNKDFINQINSINKEFIYDGYTVYTNDAVIL
jgi:FkbM family methyltransferase